MASARAQADALDLLPIATTSEPIQVSWPLIQADSPIPDGEDETIAWGVAVVNEHVGNWAGSATHQALACEPRNEQSYVKTLHFCEVPGIFWLLTSRAAH